MKGFQPDIAKSNTSFAASDLGSLASRRTLGTVGTGSEGPDGADLDNMSLLSGNTGNTGLSGGSDCFSRLHEDSEVYKSRREQRELGQTRHSFMPGITEMAKGLKEVRPCLLPPSLPLSRILVLDRQISPRGRAESIFPAMITRTSNARPHTWTERAVQGPSRNCTTTAS